MAVQLIVDEVPVELMGQSLENPSSETDIIRMLLIVAPSLDTRPAYLVRGGIRWTLSTR
ncbi:MAG: hypothetical protein ABIP19_11750 [Dermatophilaceae bacterium]